MKRILLLSALVLTGLVVNAQASFGVKAGVNFASLTNSDGGKTLLGANVGVIGQFRFDNFAVQPEVLFSLQGAKYSQSGISASSKVNYINIPVLLQYYVAPGFNLEAGPQLGFLLSAKEADIDAKEFCKSTDFALALGAAYQLEVIHLGFFARYTLGLSDIIEDNPDDAVKNNVIQLGAFLRF